MNLVKDRTYWVERPEHGTIEARLVLVSSNSKSLMFELSSHVALRNKDGMLISNSLPLMELGADGRYVDIITHEPWTIYETKPARMLPTK